MHLKPFVNRRIPINPQGSNPSTHVFQVHADESYKQLVANVDEALKYAPSGSEAAVNAVKAAVANTRIVEEAVLDAVERTNKPQ